MKVSLDNFIQLLQNKLFVGHFNQFLTLPIFGQRILLHPNNGFHFEPELSWGRTDENYDGVVNWLWKNRLPLFLKTRLYAQYKLAQFLLDFDLSNTAGFDETMRLKLKLLQTELFSRISKFSLFCNFLNSTGHGMRLVSCFLNLNVYLSLDAHSYDDQVAMYAKVRDEYLDEASPTCLPTEALNEFQNEKPKKVIINAICKHVMFRLSSYWLPRYLLYHIENDGISNKQELSISSFSSQQEHFSTMLPPIKMKNNNSKDEAMITSVWTKSQLMSRIKNADVVPDLTIVDEQMYSVFTHSDDMTYRKKMTHVCNSLMSDGFAAGPFYKYLIDNCSPACATILTLWTKLEDLRQNFQILTHRKMKKFTNTFTVFFNNIEVLNSIPDSKIIYNDLFRLNLTSCMTFPWQLRYLQKTCMEKLYPEWRKFVSADAFLFTRNFVKNIPVHLTPSLIEQSIVTIFRPNEDHAENNKLHKKDTNGRYHQNIKNAIDIDASKDDENDISPKLKMLSQCKRSFNEMQEMHKVVNFNNEMPLSYECDSDDDKSEVQKGPVYLRPKRLDMKTLASFSVKQYPNEHHPQRSRSIIIKKSERSRAPPYPKINQKIRFRANVAVAGSGRTDKEHLTQPDVFPKEHLIDRKPSDNTRTRNVWSLFFAFVRRSGRFIKYMQTRYMRIQFELYLQTAGRDPGCYAEENWMQLNANSIDQSIPCEIIYHRRKCIGRYIIAEFLVNDFRFWNEIQCFKRLAEYINCKTGYGVYDATDEEVLFDKARLICDQFLCSPIQPKCRVNIPAEVSETVITKVRFGKIDHRLFHDCVTRIFPLLIHYWSKFCFKRHKYVSRKDLVKLRRQMVLKRRSDMLAKHGSTEIQKVVQEPVVVNSEFTAVKSTEDTLIDFTDSKQFSNNWLNISKTFDATPTMSFSLATGIKLVVPIRSHRQLETKSNYSSRGLSIRKDTDAGSQETQKVV